MPNEIKTISPEEEKTPSHLPVLTVDKDDVLPTEKQDQEAAWHELKNAYITKRILSGNLIGMETTPNDNRVVGVTYFQDYKIIIPAQELIVLMPNARSTDTAEVRQQKIISSMIGAEISYMIIALDNNTQTVVASRLRANERNRQTFFFDKDDKGRYKIYEDSLVEARIIGLGASSLHVEIFGVECGIPTREISWDWITDVSERFLAAEIVRETVFLRTRDEVPYSVAVLIDLFDESVQPLRIVASILVERDSQKGILIGRGGQMLGEIRKQAGREITRVLDRPVRLELWVKVEKNWTEKKAMLKRLGLPD